MNRSMIHVDQVLTNMSFAIMQDSSQFIADKIFPIIPVQQQSGRFFKYKQEDWFRDEASERALGTESAGGDYDMDNTPTYFCTKRAYHKDVFEEDRVNATSPLDLDTDALQWVMDKLLLRREIEFANTYFKPGVWGINKTGKDATPGANEFLKLSDPNSNPIKLVADIKLQVLEMTGKHLNVGVMDPGTFYALKNHPDILDRIKYTQKGIATADLIAQLLELEAIYISAATRNTAQKGTAFDASTHMDFIYGKGMLLAHRNMKPSLKSASAGYIYAWSGLMGGNAYGGRINRFPMDHLGLGTERIEGELSYDMKVVAPTLGAFLADTI